jgi:tetratricopeptide (TPR) repeat protein
MYNSRPSLKVKFPAITKQFEKSHKIMNICRRALFLFIFIPLSAVTSNGQSPQPTVACHSASDKSSNTPLKLYLSTDSIVKGRFNLHSLIQKDTFPQDYTLNKEAVEYYQNLLGHEKDESLRKQYRLQLGINFSYAGMYDSAIALANEVIDKADTADAESKDMYFTFLFIRAMTWQRMGETYNCRTNHGPSSCILPFDKQAIHKLQTGSRNAIRYYEALLRSHPDAYVIIWLLNMCYETIGLYPDSVPRPYLIDLKKYDSPGHVLEKFVDVSSPAGVNARSSYGGADVEDFNNDGLLDIFTCSFRLSDHVHLYINDGKGEFIDKTVESGLGDIIGGCFSTHVDYNNDGFMDILIVRGGWLSLAGNLPPTLLRNNGDGTFTDVTIEAGLLKFSPCQSASWADVNNDGLPDLFLASERWDSASSPSSLYINNGNGTFKDVSRATGLYVDAFVKGAVFGDINNDGLQDLFVSTYGSENYLFLNKGVDEAGIPHFEDISKSAGVKTNDKSFGCAFFDFNNDGWEDLLVIGYDYEAPCLTEEYLGGPVKHMPKLFINNHDNTFTDIAQQAGLNRSVYAMGLNYGDIDNDGFLDLYCGTGSGSLASLFPNLMFKNINGDHFDDVTTETGTGCLQKGHSVCFGDMDNNGSLDFYLVQGGAVEDDKFFNSLFINKNNKNNWVDIRLAGTKSNKSAIGARIRMIYEDKEKHLHEVYRTVSTGASYGANTFSQKLGIGSSGKIVSIRITWPTSNIVQEFKNVQVNKFYLATEGDNSLRILDKPLIHFKTDFMPAMHGAQCH